MTFGQKIKKLRVDSGLTQKELADKMNVSFQTVSKWESDLNEPDITSIKELSKIFSCSFEYLLGDDEGPCQEAKIETVSEQENTKIGNCADCGKELFDKDSIHNYTKKTASGIDESVIVCEECYQKHEKEIDDRVAQIEKSYTSTQTQKTKKSTGPFHKITNRNDSKVLIWSIVIGALSFIISLVVCIVFNQQIGIGWTIALPIIIGYALFSDIYCIFTASWVSDVFMSVAGFSIKMPGIIFSFSADGLKFLFVMKIVLWLLGVAISIGAFLFAVALSAFFSIFTFPFLFAYNKKHY